MCSFIRFRMFELCCVPILVGWKCLEKLLLFFASMSKRGHQLVRSLIYIIISFFNGPLWTRSLRENQKIALRMPDWVFIWITLAVPVIKNIRKHTTGGVELHYGPFAWRKIMYFDHFCTLKSDFFLKWCPKCIKTFPDAILNGANRFSVKNRI